MASQRTLALLGGEPISPEVLQIVRPRFPAVSVLGERFDRALASGMVTNHSQYVQAFEAALSDYVGGDALVMNNGQTALMIMLRAAGVDGGEVIVPSFTFLATPHAVKWCGAEPVFAEIRADGSLCMDPEDVERRITEKTRAIMGVDVYGVTCDYDSFDALGEKYNLPILYDSAQAFGSRVDGKPVGSFGSAQAFSFHATKPFTSMEGGCLVTRDPALRERAAVLRNFGQDGERCPEPGINGKMLEICALVGLENLKTLDQDIDHRGVLARRMHEGLREIPGLRFLRVPPGVKPSWLYFPVIVDPAITGLNRDQIAAALAAENLLVRKYFDQACHRMDAYAEKNRDLSLPLTEKVVENVFSLPIYNGMTAGECDLFIRATREILSRPEAVRNALSP